MSLNTWLVKNLQCMLSTFELLLVLLLLSWLLQWAGFYSGLTSLLFFSESPAVSSIQRLFMHLAAQNTYVVKGQPRCPPCPFVAKKRRPVVIM